MSIKLTQAARWRYIFQLLLTGNWLPQSCLSEIRWPSWLLFSSQEGIFSSKSVWEMESRQEEKRWGWRWLPPATLLRWDVKLVSGWSQYEHDQWLDWKILTQQREEKKIPFSQLQQKSRPSFLPGIFQIWKADKESSFTCTEDESVTLISWCGQYSLDVKGSSKE